MRGSSALGRCCFWLVASGEDGCGLAGGLVAGLF